MWVVEIPHSVANALPPDVPTIPFEELAAWSGYCATTFRTSLRLPDSADPQRMAEAVRLLAIPGGQIRLNDARILLLCGTPQQIQATAAAVLQACAPASATVK
jgi:hypothetical protein